MLSSPFVFLAALSVLEVVSVAFAAPGSGPFLLKRQEDTGNSSANGNMTAPALNDTQIFQFALTLEHLENAFYTLGLSEFNESAFESAGYPSWVRGRFTQIQEHEATHVQLLTEVLGDQAPQPCNYSFPFNDPTSFAAISMALETVGQSAYLGAAPLISNRSYLETAGTILTVEGRQAAWVRADVFQGSPWNGPFETPLGPNGVFSLASQFIVSCPESNPPLPVTNLTKLTFFPPKPLPGANLTLSFTTSSATSPNSPLFLAFLRGQQPLFSPITLDQNSKNGSFTSQIPQGLQGTIYIAVVGNDTVEATMDENLLTGLGMLEFPLPPSANNTFEDVNATNANTQSSS